MLRRGVEVAVRGRNPSRDGQDIRRTQSVGGGRQAWPTAIVANSPAGTTTATRERNDDLERRLAYKHRELEEYRQQAEDFEKKLKLVNDQLEQEKLASEALDVELQEKTKALAVAQTLNGGMKRAVAGLRKEIADSTAYAHEPTRGAEFFDRLFPERATGGHPRVMGMRTQWFPGMVRETFRWKKSNACACMREVAANGLTNLEQRYADTVTLGEGGNGIVRRGRCRKTRKVYAIKKMREGVSGTALVREMTFYAITDGHKNVIEVACVNDMAGSEGLLMEVAVCDLYHACLKKSDPEFNLEQLINFEADATEGLSFMHGNGVVHCDHKLVNTLICRSDCPGGFVGKVTDPGVWCGVGETRGIKMGTPGRVPLENVLSAVPAAPDQDLFAAAVDFCYIVLTPVLKTANDNIWTLPILATREEKARSLVLHAEGGDLEQHWADIGQRTMTDGTLARVLLQPWQLNPTLPPSELHNVCEVLRKALSPNPVDRPDMSFFTSFLRGLATKTTAYVEAVVASLAGVRHPPLMEQPSLEAPIIAPAPASPAAALVQVGGGPNGGPPAVSSMDQVHLEPPLVGAPHPAGDNHDVDATVPLTEAARAGNSSAPRGSASHAVDPSAEAANPVMPFVEAIATGVASMERMHLEPPIVGAPHPELDDNGVAAALPQADDSEAGSDLAPRGSAPPVLAPALEEIHECVNPLLQPLLVLPAEVMANQMANNMRSLRLPVRTANVPPPVAVRPLPGRAYPGDGGNSGGDGGGGGDNPLLQPFPVSPAEVMANHMAKTLQSLGGGLGMAKALPPVAARPLPGQAYRGRGSGGGRGGSGVGGSGSGGKAIREGSRGVLPRNKGVKGRGFFIPGCCPSRTAECSFWQRFW